MTIFQKLRTFLKSGPTQSDDNGDLLILIKKLAGRNLRVVHSVEKREILSHQKDISSNQLFSNLFSRIVTFTKFLSNV